MKLKIELKKPRNPMVAQMLFRKKGRIKGKSNKQERAAARSKQEVDE